MPTLTIDKYTHTVRRAEIVNAKDCLRLVELEISGQKADWSMALSHYEVIKGATYCVSYGDVESKQAVILYLKLLEIIKLGGLFIEENYNENAQLPESEKIKPIIGFLPLDKIYFTNTFNPQLSDYQRQYAKIFGNNPVLSIYLDDETDDTLVVEDLATSPLIAFTNEDKNRVDTISWSYAQSVSGYIQILGSVKAQMQVSGKVVNSILTLAELRAKRNLLDGDTYVISDYGGGEWYVDTKDKTTADNTILCLVNPNGVRIKRFYDGNRINVEWAGAKGAHIDIQAEVDADFDSIDAIEMACRMVEYGGYRFGGAATVLYFPALAYNISREWKVPPYCEIEFTNDSTTIYAMNHRPLMPFQGEVIVSMDGPGWPTYKFGAPRITVRDQSIPRNSDGSRKVDAKGVMIGGLIGLRIGACRDSTIGNVTITGCYGAHGFEVKVTHPQGLDVENLTLGHIYTIRSAGGAIIATSRGEGSTYNEALGYRTGGRGQITDMQIRDCQFTTRDADNDPIEFIDEVWPIPFEVLVENGSGSTFFGLLAERIFCASKNQTCFRIDGVQSGAMVANTFERFTFEMQGKGNDGYASPGLARVDAMLVNNCHYNTFRGFGETIMPGHGLKLTNSYENTFDHLVFKNKSESDQFNNRFIRIDANSYRNKFTNIIFNLAFREDYDHQEYARAAGNGIGDGTQVQGDPNRYKIIDLGRDNTFDTDTFKSKVTLLNSIPDFLGTDGAGGMSNGTRNYDTIQCTTNADGNLEIDFPPGDNQTFQTVNLPIERTNSSLAGIVIKYRFKQRDAGVAFQLYGQRPDIYDVPGTDWLYFTVLCPSKPVIVNGSPNYDVENPFMAITSYAQDGNPKGRTVMEIQYIYVGMEGIPYVTGSSKMPYFMGSPYPGKLFNNSLTKSINDNISSAYDYVITKSGSKIKATPRLGSSLQKVSGTDAYTVIQACINALTPPGPLGSGGGSIKFGSGEFRLNNELIIIGWEGAEVNSYSKLIIEGNGHSTILSQYAPDKHALIIKNNAGIIIRDIRFYASAQSRSCIFADNSGQNEISFSRSVIDNVRCDAASNAWPAVYLKNFFTSRFSQISFENLNYHALIIENDSLTTNYGNSHFGLITTHSSPQAPYAGLLVRNKGNTNFMNLLTFDNYEAYGCYYGIYSEGLKHSTFTLVDIEACTYPIFCTGTADSYTHETDTLSFLSGYLYPTYGGTGITCTLYSSGCIFNLYIQIDATGHPVIDRTQFRVVNEYNLTIAGGGLISQNTIVNAANTPVRIKNSDGTMYRANQSNT